PAGVRSIDRRRGAVQVASTSTHLWQAWPPCSPLKPSRFRRRGYWRVLRRRWFRKRQAERIRQIAEYIYGGGRAAWQTCAGLAAGAGEFDSRRDGRERTFDAGGFAAFEVDRADELADTRL